MKLNIFILFKNRDLQAKALIESFYYCMQSYYPVNITILYDDVSAVSHMHRGATLQFKNEFYHISFVKVNHESCNIEEYFVPDEFNLVVPDNLLFTLPFNLKHLVELESEDVLDLLKGLNRQKKSVNEREGFLFGVHHLNRHVDDYLYHVENGNTYFESVPDVTPFKYYGKIFIPNASTKDVMERKHYFYPISPCFINAINTVSPAIDFYDVELTNMNNAYGLALKYLCGETIDVQSLKDFSSNSIIYQKNLTYKTSIEEKTFGEMFPQGYYINLPNRNDRREMIEKEILKIDVPTILRCEGIEASDEITTNILLKKHTNLITENFQQSQKRIGGFQSHLKAIQHAKEQQWKNVLILEDDCVFLPKAQEILNEAIKELNYLPKWDMLYLGANALAPIEQLSPHIGKLTGGYCAHAYIVSEHFYDTLLAGPIEQYLVIDAWYMDVMRDSKYNIYTVLPIVAVQGESYSDIEFKNVNYQQVLINSYKTHLNKN